jgi:hypothetical protein
MYGNISLPSILGFTTYFLLTFILSNKFEKKTNNLYLILLFVFIGASIVQVPYRLINFELTTYTLPEFFYHFFGIFMGYNFYKESKIGKWINVVNAFSACYLIGEFYKWM